MSELSDYKRIVSDPQIASLETTIRSQAERIKALEASTDGEGWVRVPAKPTDAMIEAARMTLPGPVDICDADIEDIYLTMIEAFALSPAPASKDQKQ